MISPGFALSPVILGVVLAALIALLVVRAIRKDRREYSHFKNFESTEPRQRMFRKWLLDALLAFGGSSIVILLLVWQYVPRVLDSVRTWPVSVWLSDVIADTGGVVPGFAIGLVVALVGGSTLAIYLARKTDAVPTIGDIGALLPRNRAELRWGIGLSLNAGVVEELLFRLAVPALIFGVTGSTLVAVIVSVLLFGALHVYQGIWGVVGATLLGALLMALYLVTGNILVPIVAHALIDLRSLALIPMMVYGVHRIPAGAETDVATAVPAETTGPTE